MTTRVIALDLDGTLLTPKKTLLPSSIEALARAREAGYRLIIVTGRHHVAIHPFYQALALGDQHLWVNKLDEPLQAALRIRIQASDVSLVLQPPQQTSIRNVLRAKVVNSYDDNGQVEVELEVGGKTLWARISPWARDELAIKPGLWLYAQIKSVSITA
ncbi:TOBE domain-containing protein [Escherichia coli]|uniref:TOBE domain-containing protein n=2 Tax=Escherichia coli TaxID=562 RepID=UPI0009303A61|nr:TOBE domain-containing protein [Escherichia coli]